MKKLYCVHVYPVMVNYKVEAETPEEAQNKVLDQENWCSESYSKVEVMRQCDKCGKELSI